MAYKYKYGPQSYDNNMKKKILGIQLQPLTAKSFFNVGVITLAGLGMLYPLMHVVRPPTILAWTFAAATCSLLSALGISVSNGVKHLLIIIIICVLAALFGFFIGSELQMFFIKFK